MIGVISNYELIQIHFKDAKIKIYTYLTENLVPIS